MTPTTTRPRRAIALAVVLLLGVGLGATPAPTQADGARSRPGLGFRIARTPHADGTWVGRYRVGRQLAYRTQPRKSSAQSAYHPARRVGQVSGSGPAGTRRSAWILSTYGGTPDRTTAAAVDVAVNALLHRGKWRVGAPYTVRRTNHTGDGRLIRAFAKIMVRQSRHRQGPYRTTVKARRVPVGDQTTVTVRLQNRRGLGPVITAQQRGLAVAVRYGRARTRTVFLNNHGVGRVFFRAAPGRTRITAAVHHVPDVAVFVRRPTNAAASRVAVAGHHRKVKRRVSGLAVSAQTVRITNGSTSVLVGRPLRSTYSVAGLTGHETVDYAVYGPFAAAATRCSGTPALRSKATIKSNGTRSLPRWRPGRTGFYAWGVTARGNSTTRPASACGNAYRTQRTTTTAQSRSGGGRTVTLGHAFGPHIRVSGFDRVEVHTVRTRVYGPFVHKAKTHCARGRLFRTLLTTVDNNDKWNKKTVVSRSHHTGYYVFQTTLDAGTFMRGSRSRCGNTIRVTR
jgi:hypothetical protein